VIGVLLFLDFLASPIRINETTEITGIKIIWFILTVFPEFIH
jgi:hypothetical protein